MKIPRPTAPRLALPGVVPRLRPVKVPAEVPVMILPETTLFPRMTLPLRIFEPRYRQMLADTLASHRMFAVAMQKPGRVREIPSQVAGLGLIRASVANKNGTSNLILQGITGAGDLGLE